MQRTWLILILLATTGCQAFTSDGRGMGWPWSRQPTGMTMNSEDVIAKLRGNNRPNPVAQSIKTLTQGLSQVAPAKKTAIEANDPLSLGMESKPTPEFYLGMADLAESSGNVARAAELYAAVLDLDQDNTQALAGAARTAVAQGDWPLAISHYERLLSSDSPAQASVHFGYGRALRQTQRHREAQAQFQQAIQLSPQELRYRHELAESLVETGQGQEAVTWLEPRTDSITAHLAVATMAAQRGNSAMERFHRQAALAAFQQLSSTHPLRQTLADHPGLQIASLPAP